MAKPKDPEAQPQPQYTAELDPVFVSQGGVRLGKPAGEADEDEVEELLSRPDFETSEATRAVDVSDLPKKPD